MDFAMQFYTAFDAVVISYLLTHKFMMSMPFVNKYFHAWSSTETKTFQ